VPARHFLEVVHEEQVDGAAGVATRIMEVEGTAMGKPSPAAPAARCYNPRDPMALSSGVRLGPYEIQSAIDAGGPPPLRAMHAELRRGLAVAQGRTA
jgi:hypothetical protein